MPARITGSLGMWRRGFPTRRTLVFKFAAVVIWTVVGLGVTEIGKYLRLDKNLETVADAQNNLAVVNKFPHRL